jgi:predicted Rossmann-fold nucleotide-binding protein
MDWIRERMVAEGKISESDLDLLYLTDDPREVRDHIVHRYRRRRAILEGRLPSDWNPDP